MMPLANLEARRRYDRERKRRRAMTVEQLTYERERDRHKTPARLASNRLYNQRRRAAMTAEQLEAARANARSYNRSPKGQLRYINSRIRETERVYGVTV